MSPHHQQKKENT